MTNLTEANVGAYIHNEIQRAAAKYSQYAPVNGPVPPGQYYCPLTYGIPATGTIIGGLTDWRCVPPLRRQVKAVIRILVRDVESITNYATWLQDGIDERIKRGQELFNSPGKALSVSKAFIADLNDSIEILKSVAQNCPTKKES